MVYLKAEQGQPLRGVGAPLPGRVFGRSRTVWTYQSLGHPRLWLPGQQTRLQARLRRLVQIRCVEIHTPVSKPIHACLRST